MDLTTRLIAPGIVLAAQVVVLAQRLSENGVAHPALYWLLFPLGVIAFSTIAFFLSLRSVRRQRLVKKDMEAIERLSLLQALNAQSGVQAQILGALRDLTADIKRLEDERPRREGGPPTDGGAPLPLPETGTTPRFPPHDLSSPPH